MNNKFLGVKNMEHLLTISEISKILGLDKMIIERIIARDEPDLAPYVHRWGSKIAKEYGDNNVGKAFNAGEWILELEGLPVLIKQLAYNIPTTDIIENLICQVLHLEVLIQENEALREENQGLNRELDAIKSQLSSIENASQKKGKGLKGRIDRLKRFGR